MHNFSSCYIIKVHIHANPHSVCVLWNVVSICWYISIRCWPSPNKKCLWHLCSTTSLFGAETWDRPGPTAMPAAKTHRPSPLQAWQELQTWTMHLYLHGTWVALVKFGILHQTNQSPFQKNKSLHKNHGIGFGFININHDSVVLGTRDFKKYFSASNLSRSRRCGIEIPVWLAFPGGDMTGKSVYIISLGSQKMAYDSITYDLATTDITIPEVTFIPRALWKSNKEDDGNNLRTDDLRQRFLSRLPQQCWVALGSKPVAPFKDWGPKVCGSEDATEADGQVKRLCDVFSLAVVPFPICVSKFGPNLCQYDRKHLFDAT